MNAEAESDQLNQGDPPLGIDLGDTHCPDCGRDTNRRMFSYRAYCPVCDTWWGRLKQALGLTPASETDHSDVDAQSQAGSSDGRDTEPDGEHPFVRAFHVTALLGALFAGGFTVAATVAGGYPLAIVFAVVTAFFVYSYQHDLSGDAQ